MKKIHYNKLIRDKIPEIIAKAGSKCKTTRLNLKEFEQELLKKVGEEASGLLQAKSRQELIEEIGDVLDVLSAINEFKKIKPSEIKKAQEKALARKGWFNKRLFLYWSSDDGYKSNEKSNKK